MDKIIFTLGDHVPDLFFSMRIDILRFKFSTDMDFKSVVLVIFRAPFSLAEIVRSYKQLFQVSLHLV